MFALLRVIAGSFTNGSVLTAAEYLEDIAFIQIDGGTTPYLRFFTIATAKYVERLTQHVHTLLIKNHTRFTLKDVIAIVTIENSFSFVLFNFVKDGVLSIMNYDRSIDVNNDIAVYVTCVIATTIDVATLESAIFIIVRCFTGWSISGYLDRGITNIGIPLQSQRFVVLINPTLRLNLQTRQVQFQFVTNSIVW